MLSAGGTVQGSVGYVAIERVTGTLHGRRGSFTASVGNTLTNTATYAVSLFIHARCFRGTSATCASTRARRASSIAVSASQCAQRTREHTSIASSDSGAPQRSHGETGTPILDDHNPAKNSRVSDAPRAT